MCRQPGWNAVKILRGLCQHCVEVRLKLKALPGCYPKLRAVHADNTDADVLKKRRELFLRYRSRINDTHRAALKRPEICQFVIHARMKVEERGGAGVMHWPLGLDADYWKQLTAERQVTKLVNGFPKRVWVKKDSDYNEDLDCEVLSVVALEYVKTRHNRATFYQQMSARLAQASTNTVKSEEEAVSEAPPEAFAPGRVNLSGWRR